MDLINNKSIYRKTGGGFIGSLRFTYPLLKIIVEKELIQLKPFLGSSWKFVPEDVLSIEPTQILFTSGIKINHIKKGCEHRIVFYTSNPNKLIETIQEIGFIPKVKPLQ